MKKTDVVDLESLEKYYSKVRKIRFADEVVIESLDDIYKNLFPCEPGSRYGQSDTYYSKGAHHCPRQRYRSIDDFIKLCKKYFPDTTLKTIFAFLKEKEEFYEKISIRQHLGYCPTIRKYNYRGFTSSKYTMSIVDYNLRDLNPAIPSTTVKELLT